MQVQSQNRNYYFVFEYNARTENTTYGSLFCIVSDKHTENVSPD